MSKDPKKKTATYGAKPNQAPPDKLVKTEEREHTGVGEAGVAPTTAETAVGKDDVPKLQELPDDSDRDLPKKGDLISDKYKIEYELGKGGMGAVFAATNVLTGRQVALKWMTPELSNRATLVKRFHREARIVGQVRHPNVVDVYDMGENAGAYYIVMEFLEGESLRDRMTNSGPMPVSTAVDLILPAFRGMAAAHAANIVHRDLKPANIFVCSPVEGMASEVKVLDFGVSKMLGPAMTMNPNLTKTGTRIGTTTYMSPEQAMGSSTIDHRTDIFALAIIFYEMLTGERPFLARNENDLVIKLATEDPVPLTTWLPDIPEPLWHAVQKALAREPQNRFKNITEFAEAIEGYGTQPYRIGTPVPAPPAVLQADIERASQAQIKRQATGQRKANKAGHASKVSKVEAKTNASAIQAVAKGMSGPKLAMVVGLVVALIGIVLLAVRGTKAPTPSTDPGPAVEITPGYIPDKPPAAAPAAPAPATPTAASESTTDNVEEPAAAKPSEEKVDRKPVKAKANKAKARPKKRQKSGKAGDLKLGDFF